MIFVMDSGNGLSGARNKDFAIFSGDLFIYFLIYLFIHLFILFFFVCVCVGGGGGQQWIDMNNKFNQSTNGLFQG